jgi:hypothetical protein
VTIGAPALGLSPASAFSLPAATTATLTNLLGGERVTFRLDSPTGAVLATAPASVTAGADGAAQATVTIPAGTSVGAHTVHAVGAGGSSASATFTVTTPPPALSLSATTFAALPGTTTASVTNFAAADSITFRLDGTGGTPLGTATANASGAASATLTIPSGTTTGAHTVHAVGTSGRTATAAFTSTAATVGPATLAIANGGTSRTPDAGDTIAVTFSGDLLPQTLCSGWPASAATRSSTATVRLSRVGGVDTIDVTAAACGTVRTGSVALGRSDFTSAPGTVATWSGSATTVAWDATSERMTITLGGSATVTGGSVNRISSSAATAVATYTPNAALRSLSGGPVTGTASTGAIRPF